MIEKIKERDAHRKAQEKIQKLMKDLDLQKGEEQANAKDRKHKKLWLAGVLLPADHQKEKRTLQVPGVSRAKRR